MAYDALRPTPGFAGPRDTANEPTQRMSVTSVAGGEDPGDGGRDRLAVHGIWEVLLALFTLLVAAAVHQINGDVLFGPGLEAFLLLAVSFGSVALGLGWSVRAAVPNLAVGTVAVGAAMFFTKQAEGGLGFGIGVTLAAAATAGVLLALAVVGLQVPSWAASLGLAIGVAAWLSAGRATTLPDSLTYQPGSHAVYWFVGFAAVALLGGMVGLAGPVRRVIGSFRPQGDPAERPGFSPGLVALTALVGSCLLAAMGGILTVLVSRTATSDPGIGLTGLALGAVLLGGTSAYGRRGGFAGTLLGVLLLTLVIRLSAAEQWQVPVLAYGAVAILVGLFITRLVEVTGQPESEMPDDDPEWSGPETRPARPRGPLALPAGNATEEVARGTVVSRGLTGPDTTAGAGTPGSRGPVLQGRIGDRATRVRYPAAGTRPVGGTSQPLLPNRGWDTGTRGGFSGPLSPSPY